MVGMLINERQRGYGKVLDMVLNNYWKVFLINMIVDGPVGIIA
jgi:hypothetical protein